MLLIKIIFRLDKLDKSPRYGNSMEEDNKSDGEFDEDMLNSKFICVYLLNLTLT
jgi:hypothetical protein